jgi:hypothetical protein
MAPTDMAWGPVSASEWWGRHRLRYNIGLVVAGFLAFACYVGVVAWGDSIGAVPNAEINLFTTAFQAVGYLFMMAVANICYFLGPLSERIIKPTVFRALTVQHSRSSGLPVLDPSLVVARIR